MANDKIEKKDNKDSKDKVAKKRRSPIRFLKEMCGELKKLTWPTGRELINYTATVIAFVLVFAAIIGLLDLLFSQALGFLTRL